MAKPHNEAFLRIRDLVLSLSDADRTALTRLFGAVRSRQPDLPPSTIAALRSIMELEDDGVLRLGHWFRTYVNQWGQVPQAAARASNLRPSREVVQD